MRDDSHPEVLSGHVSDSAEYVVDEHGLITFADEACVRLLGYESSTELIGRNAHDLFHRCEHCSHVASCEQCPACLQGKDPATLLTATLQMAHKDGHLLTIDCRLDPLFSQGAIVGARARLSVVDPHVRQMRQLQIHEQIFATSQEAIIITSTNHTVVRVNEAFEQLSGYHANEILGQSARIFRSERQGANFQQEVEHRIETSGRWEGEYWCRCKNGRSSAVWGRITAARGDDGKVTHYISVCRDLQQIKAARQALTLWQRAIDSTVSAVFILTADSANRPVHYANPGFERITGYSSAEIVGKPCYLLEETEWNTLHIGGILTAIREHRDGNATLGAYRKDGKFFWFDLYVSPVRGDDDVVTHYICTMNDVTDRQRSATLLERQAHYDIVTGLPNRFLFTSRVQEALAQADPDVGDLAVLSLDLDRFNRSKYVLGNTLADVLLAEVAARLSDAVCEGDTVARQEADRFSILLCSAKSGGGVATMVLAIVAAMSIPFEIDEHIINLDCCIGVAPFPTAGNDWQTLLRNADGAMIRAKDQGPSNVQFHDEAMNRRMARHARIKRDLHFALEKEELHLAYQPVMSLRSGELVGMEALLRWNHPELGPISPATFIPIAEESNLIIQLSEWVLHTACRQYKAWHELGGRPVLLGVNVAARQFRQSDFVDRIAKILVQTGFEPRYLDLEISESMAMRDVEMTIPTLHKLRQLGVRLSLDDFGTGFTSLGHLKRLPLAALKIDRTFVLDISTDPDDATIVRSMISLAHEMQLQVIAEGVETAAQRDFLRASGCDAMQGFLFSPAVEPTDFQALLRENRTLPLGLSGEHVSKRTLLILDDEDNILTSLKRLLRRDGYEILVANNAADAFNLLTSRPVGVILSDQRMPEMSGTEFLRRVKRLYPDTMRIVLSGYTELTSVTEAINEGAVYKFLTKPWDDDHLRAVISEAFVHHERIVNDNAA